MTPTPIERIRAPSTSDRSRKKPSTTIRQRSIDLDHGGDEQGDGTGNDHDSRPPRRLDDHEISSKVLDPARSLLTVGALSSRLLQ